MRISDWSSDVCSSDLEADWDAVMDTNLKTLFFLCQAVGRHMIARIEKEGGSGKIINIASMLTFQGGIRVPSYTASKSGVGGLTRLLANEWAAKGVQVNAIAPGYIATNNTAALQGDETRNRQIVARIPAGRSEEHTSELQSLMRNSYAVFCLKTKKIFY